MPGLYNNETGEYDEVDWAMDAGWYEDDEGRLYIIAPDWIVDESIGPDNRLMERLNGVVARGHVIADAICDMIGVTRVPQALKRFSPEDGYYSA